MALESVVALAQDHRLTGRRILLLPHPNSTALRKRASSKGCFFVCVVTDVCSCVFYAFVYIYQHTAHTCIRPVHCTHMHGASTLHADTHKAIGQSLVLLLSQCLLRLKVTNLARLTVSEPLRCSRHAPVCAWLLCGSPRSLIHVLTLV